DFEDRVAIARGCHHEEHAGTGCAASLGHGAMVGERKKRMNPTNGGGPCQLRERSARLNIFQVLKEKRNGWSAKFCRADPILWAPRPMQREQILLCIRSMQRAFRCACSTTRGRRRTAFRCTSGRHLCGTD